MTPTKRPRARDLVNKIFSGERHLTNTPGLQTTCRICGQQFPTPTMQPAIIGAPPDADTKNFVGSLATHLISTHADKWAAIEIGGQEFMGFLILGLFESQDVNLMMKQEQARYGIQQMTRKRTISDADILDRVARLELDPEKEQETADLLQDMRDLLTEQGQYGL